MSISIALKKLWVPVAAGILLGVLVNEAKPRRAPVAYSYAPTFAGCEPDSQTNACNCDRGLTLATERKSPAAHANELLVKYANSLCKLADAAETFGRTPIDGQEQLQQAAKPLAGAIHAVNTGYQQLLLARLPLTIDILVSADSEAESRRLVCGMKGAHRFQWDTFRNNLNTLLLNVVVAWQGNADSGTYQNIRRQQESDWPKLALILRRGCEQYGRTSL